MKKLTLFLVLFVCSTNMFSQNITATLGTGGAFKIKDATNNYLTVSQPTGHLSLNKSLVIPNSTDSTLGVIFKGADRFIHNYGTNNTFIGLNAGNFSMTGSANTASGYQSLSSNTAGYWNTANGYQSLFYNTTGSYNTASGMYALQYNTTGSSNTANGVYALSFNNTGSYNTASGMYALQSNTTGSANTASGLSALQNNSTGSYNTANGVDALAANTTGYDNTANGVEVLFYNTTGSYNTANGVDALHFNSTGTHNTANGSNALYSNTAGNFNTANGYQSLYSNTTGFDNTTLGYHAGFTITTGNNLTCIGYNAEPTSAIATNQITLGNSSVTSLRCNVTTITSLSDVRDKKNVKDLNLGIDFLMKIKPRLYNWDKREWYENNISDGSKMKEEPTAGFIAQELDEVQTDANAEWLNLVLKDNPEKLEATPGNLLPIIVKSIQDVKKENDELKIANDKLKATTVSLTDRLTRFEQTQNMLVAEIEKLKTNNNEITIVSLGEK